MAGGKSLDNSMGDLHNCTKNKNNVAWGLKSFVDTPLIFSFCFFLKYFLLFMCKITLTWIVEKAFEAVTQSFFCPFLRVETVFVSQIQRIFNKDYIILAQFF